MFPLENPLLPFVDQFLGRWRQFLGRLSVTAEADGGSCLIVASAVFGACIRFLPPTFRQLIMKKEEGRRSVITYFQ